MFGKISWYKNNRKNRHVKIPEKYQCIKGFENIEAELQISKKTMNDLHFTMNDQI